MEQQHIFNATIATIEIRQKNKLRGSNDRTSLKRVTSRTLRLSISKKVKLNVIKKNNITSAMFKA
jgi:hypothetical protein